MDTKILRDAHQFVRECSLANSPLASPEPSVLSAFFPQPTERDDGLDAKRLEDRMLYSATPVVLEAIDVDSVEDAPDTTIQLLDHFTIDDGGGTPEFQIIENSNQSLFSEVRLEDLGQLVLDYADDMFGQGQLTIEGTDAFGNVEHLPINVGLESVNDAPTAVSLQTVTDVNLSTGRTTIDLFAAFDDLEDADELLTYELIGNTNPDLFSSVTIDVNQGLMILEHAEGAEGTAQLTVQATDTGRLSVGAGTPEAFTVYESHGGTELSDAFAGIDVKPLNLLGHWHLFDYDAATDTYDTSELNVERLTEVLQNYDDDPSIPVIVDIETQGYDNTTEGRDRLARVFDIISDLRPDLNLGLYRLMPERNWWDVVNLAINENLDELGYEVDLETRQTNYQAWLDRNELYRTEPVSEEYGGQPLSEMVDSINPSLYTFYEDSLGGIHSYRRAELDADANRVYVDAPSYDSVDQVRFIRPVGTELNNGLKFYTTYYVVNADDESFQLSETPNGPAIDFTDDFDGHLIVGTPGPEFENMWHDMAVTSWERYATEAIAEARKYGDDKPVHGWLSPSLYGTSEDYLEGDFFRHQLEILRSHADGVVLFEMRETPPPEFHVNQGWWTALRDFIDSLDTPAATVTVEITQSDNLQSDNLAPIAKGDDLQATEDTALYFDAATLLSNDLDLEGESLHLQLAEQPSHGTLQHLGSGQWVYTPDPNFAGADYFTYQASDGTQLSNAVMVEIDVRPVADELVAHNDTFIVDEDRTLKFSTTELIANDTNLDHRDVSLDVTNGPEFGTLSRNADGTYYYRSEANFYGTDQFIYQISDGVTTSQATVTIEVRAANDRPIAVADRFQVVAGGTLEIDPQQLLDNDVDAENDALTIDPASDPLNGSLHRLANGRFQYIADSGFVGFDRFEYRVSDGQLDSLTTVVEVEVMPRRDTSPANQRPVALPDRFVTAEDQPLVIHTSDLLANDRDADNDSLRMKLIDNPDHGSLRRHADGTIVYTPSVDFFGSDRFGYRVTDGKGHSDVVAVQIRVTPVNDAPIATGEVYRVAKGGQLRVGGNGVLTNDVDIEGDGIRVAIHRGPEHGKLILHGNGTFSYEPHARFSGTDRFIYQLTDARGATSLARAVIRVESLVDAELNLRNDEPLGVLAPPPHDDTTLTVTHLTQPYIP